MYELLDGGLARIPLAVSTGEPGQWRWSLEYQSTAVVVPALWTTNWIHCCLDESKGTNPDSSDVFKKSTVLSYMTG